MRPNAVSYCCHFSHRSCLTSCFTFYSFFTTLVATRRCRCLLRSARVNVMPERLLSVISGILAGGIPGFRIELCCFHHPPTWPLCVFRVFFVLLLVRWPFSMTHKMSSCMLFPLLVAIPLLCVFCLFWFGCGCVFLVCLVSFVSGCGFLVLAGTARWTVYRSTTSTFVAIDKLTALHDNYNSSFCCD